MACQHACRVVQLRGTHAFMGCAAPEVSLEACYLATHETHCQQHWHRLCTCTCDTHHRSCRLTHSISFSCAHVLSCERRVGGCQDIEKSPCLPSSLTVSDSAAVCSECLWLLLSRCCFGGREGAECLFRGWAGVTECSICCVVQSLCLHCCKPSVSGF